jgi:hypothetical protein
VAAPGCTSERGKTHVTEALEVLYPWHPWFGRTVYIHEVIERGDERAMTTSAQMLAPPQGGQDWGENLPILAPL